MEGVDLRGLCLRVSEPLLEEVEVSELSELELDIPRLRLGLERLLSRLAWWRGRAWRVGGADLSL